MPRLDWNATGQRFFETGVDRGVLYVGGGGFAWPGLTKVTESPSGGGPRPFYRDGIKYLNLASAEDFEATIEAFSSPPQFAQCDGMTPIHNGLFATQQRRKPFGLSYRTRIGNDTDGMDHAYKIHLVYNALAAPSERAMTTLSADNEANPLSWSISTLPPRNTGLRPTAHFIIDSRYVSPGLMRVVEDVLYGSGGNSAYLPSISELIELFNAYIPARIAQTQPGVWELFLDPINGRTFLTPTRPGSEDGDVLWLDTSQGDYAIPKLVTGG